MMGPRGSRSLGVLPHLFQVQMADVKACFFHHFCVAAAWTVRLDQQTLQATPIALGTGDICVAPQNVQSPVHQTERGDVDGPQGGLGSAELQAVACDQPARNLGRQGQNDLN